MRVNITAAKNQPSMLQSASLAEHPAGAAGDGGWSVFWIWLGNNTAKEEETDESQSLVLQNLTAEFSGGCTSFEF